MLQKIIVFIKDNINITVVLTLCIFFFEKIEKIIYKTIVDKILLLTENNLLNDIIFFIISLSCLIYSYYLSRKNNYFKKGFIYKCAILLLILIYFRNYNFDYDAIELKSINKLYYIDIIYVIVSIPLITFVINSIYNTIQKYNKKKNEKDNKVKNNDIKTDTPLTKNFNPKTLDLANIIFSEIISIKNNECTSIGITGKWGTGKTTLTNSLKTLLKRDKNVIIIDYNPWLNINNNNLNVDFFNHIKSELKNHSYTIDKTISKYSNLFKSLDNNSIIGEIIDLFKNEESIQNQYIELDKEFTRIHKKIIVFIDDLDRLMPNEIITVLTLIRNTANFSSFTYITSFDKQYINQSLKNLNIPNSHNYTDKIFLKEYSTAPLLRDEKIDFLIDEFKTNLDDFDKNDFIYNCEERNIIYGFNNTSITIIDVLENYRDLIKIRNQIIPFYKKHYRDLCFNELFIIQILKLKYYNIYYLLLFNMKDFFDDPMFYIFNDTNENKLRFTKIDDKNLIKQNEFKSQFLSTKLYKFIIENYNYSENELVEIDILLSKLFISPINNNLLSINYKINYYKYFNEIIDNNNFTYSEFLNIYNKNIINSIENILELNKLQLESFKIYLGKYHEQIKSFEKLKSHLYKVLNITGYLTDYESCYSVNNDVVFRYFNKNKDILSIEGFNEKELFEFLIEIIKNGDIKCSLYYSQLLRDIIKDHRMKDYESYEKDLFQILDDIFIRYSNQSNETFDYKSSIRLLFNTNRNFDSTIKFSEISKEKFKHNAIKNYNQFFFYCIKTPPFYHYFINEENKIGIDELMITIFNSMNELIFFIEDNKSEIIKISDLFDESLTFFEKFIEDNTIFIHHTFQSEQINTYLKNKSLNQFR